MLNNRKYKKHRLIAEVNKLAAIYLGRRPGRKCIGARGKFQPAPGLAGLVGMGTMYYRITAKWPRKQVFKSIVKMPVTVWQYKEVWAHD